MIIPEEWADRWLDAWSRRDVEAVLRLYGDEIVLHSPFAQVYARGGVVRGKGELRSYYEEINRRIVSVV